MKPGFAAVPASTVTDPLSITLLEPILEKFREIGKNITFWADNILNSMSDNPYSKADHQFLNLPQVLDRSEGPEKLSYLNYVF
jgi:hypothetical protein